MCWLTSLLPLINQFKVSIVSYDQQEPQAYMEF